MGLPYDNIVFPLFDQKLNVAAELPGYTDVTSVYLALLDRPAWRKRLILGQDFDDLAYLASAMMRLYMPPGGNLREPVVFIEDELCFDGTEIDGAPELARQIGDRFGLTSRDCLMIADASGARRSNEKPPSWPHYQDEGFQVIYPNPKSSLKNNPRVHERFNMCRFMICSADDQRRLFVHPRCERLREAFRVYPCRKNSRDPERGHWAAHICDAVMYPVYRLLSKEAKKGLKR